MKSEGGCIGLGASGTAPLMPAFLPQTPGDETGARVNPWGCAARSHCGITLGVCLGEKSLVGQLLAVPPERQRVFIPDFEFLPQTGHDQAKRCPDGTGTTQPSRTLGQGGAAAPWEHPPAPGWDQQYPSTSPHLHPSLCHLWLHFGLICLILRAPISHGARAYRSAGRRRDPFSFPSQRGTWLLFFYLPLVLQGRDHHGLLHPSRADFTIP